MKRIFFFMAACMIAGSPTLSAQQVLVTSGPLDPTGELDGVLFNSGGLTLSVNTGIQNINTSNQPTGAIVTAAANDDVVFTITSGTSTVTGAVGVAGAGAVNNIAGGLGTSAIIFNGQTVATTFNITGNGTMQFNALANGALNYNTNGILNVGTGQTFTGALTNSGANTGILTLNGASTQNGAVAVGSSPLNQVNALVGNATIIGATSATNFSLNTNTLSIIGALALPVNSVINTTVVSNALFGNVSLGSHDDEIAAPVVTVNVSVPSTALLSSAPLFVVSAGSGSSGVPILVTSNNPRYTFVGLNLNGNIEIFPTLIPTKAIVTNPAVGAVGSTIDNLVTIAAANPGTDLAFVVSQLLALSPAALENALLQIAPASGLVGVAQESFHATRQFQRVWLENLQRNRYYCLQDPCCNPAGEIYAGPRVWVDGFGYYGHQDNKDNLNGYRANTWGGVLAYEIPILCGLRAGIGGGIAYTDLNEREFGNKTEIHNYQATLYFTYDTNPWFVDGGFSLGWDRFDGTRHIVFPGVDRTARAKYNGREYSAFVATGYRYYYNCFEITPLATLLYSHLNIDDYTETGAISLNQYVDKQRYNFTESGLGLKLAYLYNTSCGFFIPEVHSLWLYDYNETGLFANSSFTGIGAAAGTYPNIGPRIDRNTWNIGGSLTFMTDCMFTVQVFYDYERSKTYFDHQGMVEFAIDF